ncbi:MAG: hypothetical protein K2Q28_02220 [Hyphomicrobium sp.]|nr:hypothetical protein [Hyphomicrobium sp.]
MSIPTDVIRVADGCQLQLTIHLCLLKYLRNRDLGSDAMTKDLSAGSDAAHQLIATLAKRCPDLEIVPSEHSAGELGWNIPVQQGLTTELWLSFSNNDEMHFSLENFRISFFPCTDSIEGEKFVDAVSGFIDGTYQIIEHYRGSRCVRADLQKPNGDEWETIASSSRLHWPLPYRKTFKTIKNG